MKPWTNIYAPKTEADVIGEEAGIKELKEFIENFAKQKKKASLIYGPPGTGKTSSVYALANDLSLEVMEVNASDFRNKDQINSLVGQASRQRSLFSKGKIILVDEIDGLSGTEDRGGISAIVEAIEKTSFPIILTATNPWDTKFSKVRSKSVMIQYHALNYLSIFEILKKICITEKIKYDEGVLKTLARKAGGDARAAINDLQSLVPELKELTRENVETLGERDQTETMISALMIIFKTTDPKVALHAFENIEENQDEAFLWIDENLPKEYEKPHDLARAYDALSKADVFRRRIRRWQHYRFMVYINALLTGGIAVAKDEKYHKFVKYAPTGRILKLWIAGQKFHKKKEIAKKLGSYTHTSAKKALQSMVPYLQIICKKNAGLAENIGKELRLEEEELDWLKK
jgi:replication factor C large subunit